MLGPPPIPSALAALRGNPGKQAINHQEPIPDPLPGMAPPKHLNAAARAIWRAEAPPLAACGLLRACDVTHFALWCEAVAEYRALSKQISALPPDASLIQRGMCNNRQQQLYTRIRDLGDRFGMNPSARTRLQVEAPKKGKLASFIQQPMKLAE